MIAFVTFPSPSARSEHIGTGLTENDAAIPDDEEDESEKHANIRPEDA